MVAYLRVCSNSKEGEGFDDGTSEQYRMSEEVT